MILYDELGSNGMGLARFLFRFRPNGASNPAVANIFGNGIVSITYSGTGTGIYLVTFQDNYASLIVFNASVQTNVGGPAQGFTFDIDAAQTILANSPQGAVLAIAGVNPSGSRATIASDANTYVLCEAVFSTNSLVTP